ncbi:oxysterol-binding protein 2-like, partial [Pseudonaja textilis]|uniref:oxysterol-binding protein 2-like n=1 Tax=Pseudonaja textilis TaxID=8673 RepID=UPI000EA8A00A
KSALQTTLVSFRCRLLSRPHAKSSPPLSDPFSSLPQACRDFLDLAEAHSRKWQRALQHECEQRIRLEETIEQLAKQHNNLERACRGAPSLSANPAAHASRGGGSVQSGKAEPSDEDEETEYFDAMEDAQAVIAVASEPSDHHR